MSLTSVVERAKEEAPTAGRAYSPGHLTGFFTIHMEDSPLNCGSAGTGICLQEGIITEVSLGYSLQPKVNVSMNGSFLASAPTCESVFKAMVPSDYPVIVAAKQKSRLPVGFGYGVSGASALSLGLALNHALGLNLTSEKIGQIAHIAEVEQLTGLGDVSAQLLGGYEIRLKPGAPGIGEARNLDFADDPLVLTSPVMSFSTSTMITKKEFVDRINQYGSEAMESFGDETTLENFMVQSRYFWERIGLMNDSVKKVVKAFDKAGVSNASAKKGVVFGLVDKDDLKKVIGALMPKYRLNNFDENIPPVISDPVSGLRLIISEVSKRGAFCWG